MTVDSNARRQAILFEVAAVADRYEQDQAPEDTNWRVDDLRSVVLSINAKHDSPEDLKWSLREAAGQLVAWLEHLEAEKAKA